MSDIQGSDIVWEDPPGTATGRPGVRHAAIAAELRARPGEWAKVATAASSQMARDIKKARYLAYVPAGSFEAVSRNNRTVNGRKSPVAEIYARYVGDGEVA
jgi:hypothetical protein